jgi:hypothetical protein
VRQEFLTQEGFTTNLWLLPGRYELVVHDADGAEQRLALLLDAAGATVDLP